MNNSRTVLYEYESPWSIIENIKVSNVVNTRQFLNAFGSEAAANTGNIISKRYLNLWTFEGINDQKFKLYFGESLSAHTENIKNKLTNMLPIYIKTKSLFRDQLYFCKECIKAGYHSILHQFKMTEICPYHMVKLENVCPSCKQSIPYGMPGHHIETGFVCNCGEFIGAPEKLNLTLAEFTLEDASMVSWLGLSQEDKEVLQNTIIFKPFLDQGANLMKSMLELLQDITIDQKVFSMAAYNNTTSPNITLENNYNHFFISLESIFHGFENYLLKTVMKNHAHCLKRFLGLYKKPGEEFPPICPYAYAYVFWKESFLNINPFIDQYKKSSLFHKRITPYEVPFYYMQDEFRELLMFYRSLNPRTLTWVFTHLLWELADHHFKEWLEVAREYAQNKVKPNLDSLETRLPPPIVLFPQRENRLEKFTSNQIIPDKLPCPYEANSKINDEEISVLPMRLAINDGSIGEKKAAESYLKRLRSSL